MSERGLFNGKTGFIIATAASAVGLGNIWRFPTEAAKHGGGSFVLIYIAIVILFGLTMMVTEIAIGRKTRRSPIEAYGSLDKRFRIIGMLSSWVPAIILPYYCVIGGWLLGYLFGYSAGFDLSDGATVFSDFVSSYECLVTFEVLRELRPRAGIRTRPGELERLQDEEGTLEELLQNPRRLSAIEREGVARCVVYSRRADVSGL